MKLSTWAKKEGIAYITAWRWVKADRMPVPFIKTPSGAILVDDSSQNKSLTCIYCRVSSSNKKDDLDQQVERCLEFCRTKGWIVNNVFKEVASGMNDSRPKLMKLLDLKPSRIVVEHKDRLTRFGFGYFDKLLPMMGCELIVIDRATEAKDDLLHDLVSIITSFCCRLYGMRRGRSVSDKVKKCVEPSE